MTRSTLPTGEVLRQTLARRRDATLQAIVVRRGNSRHAQPQVGRLTRDTGLVGDRWASFRPILERQLTLMDVRVVRLLLAERRLNVEPQLFAHDALDVPGDNLILDLPTGVTSLPAGTRLRIGSALIETNDVPHLGCKKFAERFGSAGLDWVNDPAHYDLRLRGLNARVIEDGDIQLGDRIAIEGKASHEPASVWLRLGDKR